MDKRSRFDGTLASAGLLIACAACSSKSALPTTASLSIGADGGTLGVSDPSSPLDGLVLEVPPGALAHPTTITISEVVPAPRSPPGFEARGPTVRFEPDGLRFATPATLTMPSTSTSFTDRTDIVFEEIDGGLAGVPNPIADAETGGQETDPAARTVSMQILHFTDYTVQGNQTIEQVLAAARQSGFGAVDRPCPSCRTRDPSVVNTVIVHSTEAGPQESFADVLADEYTASSFAHYYIDKDGTVIEMLPESQVAPQAGGGCSTPSDPSTCHYWNTQSIGIELYNQCVPPPGPPGCAEAYTDYTPQQLHALETLTQTLMARYALTADDVLRHKDCSNGDPAHDRLHADPYGWSEDDWAGFKARIAAGASDGGAGDGGSSDGGADGGGDGGAQYGITVILGGEGSGSVSADPPGFQYSAGAVVDLAAVPDPASTFSGWGGDCSGSGGCELIMSTDHLVVANFALADAGTDGGEPSDAGEPTDAGGSDGGQDGGSDICCCNFDVNRNGGEWVCVNASEPSPWLCYVPWPSCCDQAYTVCP